MSDYENYESANGGTVDLTAFDDDFTSAEAPSFEEVPDGKYLVKIESVRLGNSKKGDPMIKWDLIVRSGDHAGRHVFKNSVITAAALPFVKGDLKTLGMDLTKFSDLQSRLEELLDVSLEITKRTNGEYSNVYFNRKVDVVADADGNQIPF